MTTPGELMSAFLAASNGKLTPNLMKYTAALEGDRLKARIVVLNDIAEEELDTVFEILGDTVGHIGGTAAFDLVRASSVAEANSAPELPIKLYRSYSLDAAR